MAENAYEYGAPLPSCRQLAKRLGVSHNTVYMVYQRLARRGVLRAVRGSGFRLSSSAIARDDLRQVLKERFLGAVHAAKSAGYSQSEVRGALEDIVREAFEQTAPVIAFVECSRESSSRLSANLHAQLGTRVQTAVLTSDCDQLRRAVADCDLICTTLYHLREVEDALQMPGKVVGLRHVPETDSLLQIARIRSGARVLVIGSNERTLEQLVQTVESHHGRPDAAVLPGQLVPRLLEENQVVVTVHEAFKRCPSLAGLNRSQVIIVTYAIDSQSVAYLHKRVGELRSHTLGDGERSTGER